MLRRGLRPARRARLSTALLLAVVFVCGGCASRDAGSTSGRKVAILGWDGATWDVIDPLLRRGELPNVARLLERGGRAVLLADEPLLSPVVWTTLATGFPAQDHGVTGFQMPDASGTETILAASFHRRRAPLWKIASWGGRQVGFIGWWTTWPAEVVDGYMVSDHLAYNRWDAWARRPELEEFHLTYPESLAAELAPSAVPPERVTPETLAPLAAFDERERAEMMQATRPVMFHAPSVTRFGYSTDASNQAFARYLLDHREQPDLFALVYILSDVAGHVFWHAYQPELYPGDNADASRLHEAVPNVYRLLDRWTGEILDRLDPDTVVVLVSDHGMAAKRVLPRPGVNPSGDHTPQGVFVISGPGMPGGADLGILRGVDLAPTVLSLLGLPVAEDMPGTVLPAALPPDGAAGVRWVPTYGDGRSETPSDLRSPGEGDYEERLRSLGYIR